MRRSRRGMSIGSVLVLILILVIYYVYFRGGSPASQPAPGVPVTSATATVSGAAPVWGKQAKTSGCKVNGALQDTECTPGDVLPNVTKTEICKSGYASATRNVTEEEKNAVYAEYGIRSRTAGEYEVDHLVSLELGGSNDISNLWPEAAAPTPGFHQKDKVENYMHDQVCSGAISLADAQQKIATDWLVVYQSMPK
jgi:hypothetical protein